MTPEPSWVLVTGAGGGIGTAIVERLLESGHPVAAADRGGLDRLDALAERYGDLLDRAECDVRDPAGIEALLDRLEDRLPIGAVVTVAAVQRTGASEDYALEDWNRILDVNLTGTWIPVQGVLRRLLRSGGGRVVTISSEIGLSGAPYYSAYAASKGAVIALTKSLAKEYASRGILVNSVAPGPIETGIFLGERGHNREWLEANVPLGRFGAPDDVAHLVEFLLSGRADYFTGQVLSPNGGVVI